MNSYMINKYSVELSARDLDRLMSRYGHIAYDHHNLHFWIIASERDQDPETMERYENRWLGEFDLMHDYEASVEGFSSSGGRYYSLTTYVLEDEDGNVYAEAPMGRDDLDIDEEDDDEEA